MIRCHYDNSNCYKAKALAKISAIDASQGYKTGGQILTVKGTGFTSDNINTTIDGVPCKLLSRTLYQFTCMTGAQPSPSNETYYLGQKGLRLRFYNTTT